MKIRPVQRYSLDIGSGSLCILRMDREETGAVPWPRGAFSGGRHQIIQIVSRVVRRREKAMEVTKGDIRGGVGCERESLFEGKEVATLMG